MTPFRPKRLLDCLNILDMRQLAERRLPAPLFHYLDGAAETELTARRNTSAFDDICLVPHCLVDVTSVRTSRMLLGQEVAWPVMCSPSGASRLYHPDGECAVARAASATGTLYSLSVMATHSLETIATVSGPKIFQILLFRDRDLTWELVSRAANAGYQALCLTVDAAVRGKRERELRTGLGLPLRPSARTLASIARRPTWFLGQMHKGPLELAHLCDRTGSRSFTVHSRYAAAQLDTGATWADVRHLKERWSGALAIKGIMSADDARRAVDVGATAIVVSNHGGRQLDGAAAPIDVLPEIARAVGGRAEVILDGGIRRGSHVLKALACGATACAVGRAPLYGLAAGGEAGVRRMLELLRAELVLAMQLCGCTDVTDVDPQLIRRP